MQRTMKDSGIEWIGEIPANWGVSKIKFVADFEPCCDFGGISSNDRIAYAPMECVKQGVYEARDVLYGEVSHSLTPFQNGDIVMAKVTPCFENGNIALMEELPSGIGLGSSELFVFRAKHNTVAKYLFYWLQNLDFIQRACSTMTGVGGLKRVSSFFCRNCEIQIPPHTEQHHIADYLDRKCGQIDAIIARQQEVIEKLKAYKRSVITEAVTKGLNPNVPMKDSGIEWIGKIPVDWTVVPLKRVVTFSKGLPITKDDLTEHGVPVVSYGQIHSKTNSGTHLQDDLIRFVSETYFESNPSSLGRKGDIFFADTSEDYVGIGNAVLVDRDTPVFAGYHTIIVRPEEQSYSRYLAYLFLTDTWRSQLCSRASGIKVFSITQGLLKKTMVILPPVENVAAMTDYLDRTCEQIDATVTRKQALIEKLKAYKKSLIYEVVTGKKEISNLCGLRGEVTEGLTGGLNPPLQTHCAPVAPRTGQ